MQTIVKYFVALFLLLVSQFFQYNSEKGEIANTDVVKEEIREWPAETMMSPDTTITLEC